MLRSNRITQLEYEIWLAERVLEKWQASAEFLRRNGPEHRLASLSAAASRSRAEIIELRSQLETLRALGITRRRLGVSA